MHCGGVEEGLARDGSSHCAMTGNEGTRLGGYEMPLYLVYAKDHKGGLDARLASRNAHIALGDDMVAEGKLLFGAATVEDGQMSGSVLIGNFANREEVDEWLSKEPYITGNVWDKVEVEEIRVGPSFAKILPAAWQ